MIGKIKKGKSFGGCVRYVMGKDDAKILASDGVLLGTNKEMIDSFNCQCLLNPKIKQPLGLTTAMQIAAKLTLTDGENSKTVEFPKVEIEANQRSNIAGGFTAE